MSGTRREIPAAAPRLGYNAALIGSGPSQRERGRTATPCAVDLNAFYLQCRHSIWREAAF